MEPRTVITKESEGGAIGVGLAVVPGTSANQAKLPAAAGDRAYGISALKADAAAKQFPVIVHGFAKAIAKSAIAIGDPVEVDGTDGRLKPAAPAAGVNAEVVGLAFSAAAADGDEFDLFVAPSRLQG